MADWGNKQGVGVQTKSSGPNFKGSGANGWLGGQNPGQMLSNVGAYQGQCRPNCGPMLGKCWANLESILGRFGTDLGQFGLQI